MPESALIVDTNVREFFHGLVTDAVNHQGIETRTETIYYVVNLLVSFADARALYEPTPDGLMIKPLAALYGEALNAPDRETRTRRLRRLGDVALFIAGVFADSLSRKPVDVDYYIAMGGNAYSYLSDTTRSAAQWQTLSAVFEELAAKFTGFVDVLCEVREHTPLRNDRDILRLYEVWVRTGSPRSARKLRQIGIEPVSGSVSFRQH